MGFLTWIKIFLFTGLWLLVSFVLGILLNGKKRGCLRETILKGIVLQFAVFEILVLIAICLRMKFHTLCYIYSGLVFLLLLAVVVYRSGNIVHFLKKRKEHGIWEKKEKSIWILMAVVFICLQTFISVRFMHVDDDDAFYVATAATTIETDSIFEYNAYTGNELAERPARYILSPFPIFVAFMAKVFGVPAAVFAHTCMPLLFIPTAYLIYSLYGSWLWKGKIREQGIFLLFLAWINIMGYYSVYTSSVFLLVRIWQGKAILAGVLLPMLFWELLMQGEKQRENSGILTIIVLAAALCSSMGIFLSPVMIGVAAVIQYVQNRKKRLFFSTLLSCVPCVILGFVYLMIR